MTTSSILITGAGGEIGRGLLEFFATEKRSSVITLDLAPLPPDLRALATTSYQGDILDAALLRRIESEHSIDTIFHLAAILSTEGERDPIKTHRVNVEGSIALIELAQRHSLRRGVPVKFIFPSSIAVYGLPPSAPADPITEDQHLQPTTMYGLNKLYLEQFGTYFNRTPDAIDFRCVRLPGVVSGVTLPSGGTSDYFPEMIHAAARGTPYRCFVTPESRIPFMMMPDAVKALIDLSRAPRESLRRCVYNVSALSLTAAEIRDRILSYFPDAEISFQPQPKRLAIVQSWPRDVDDSAACAEWGWSPRFGLDAAFDEYLIPHIRSLVTNQPSTSLSVAS